MWEQQQQHSVAQVLQRGRTHKVLYSIVKSSGVHAAALAIAVLKIRMTGKLHAIFSIDVLPSWTIMALQLRTQSNRTRKAEHASNKAHASSTLPFPLLRIP
jgi:hypothetical protein